MRADQLLLQRAFASSRSQAQRLIASGVRWRVAAAEGGTPHAPWKRVGKNSDELPADATIELLDASEAKYVSRGGLKLEGALASSGIPAQGKTCLDVGQSTGGFTDCLLQHGAKQVVGVDVGSGQLHPSMRGHAQVVVLENLNARTLAASDLVAAFEEKYAPDSLEEPTEHDESDLPDLPNVPDVPAVPAGESFDGRFDLIVGDLSFISQTLVLPALVPLLKPGADVLMLVKPQFELQPGQVGKGGIVKDPAMYRLVEKRIRDCCAGLGLSVQAWLESPITGGDGNREFFIHAKS